MRWQKELKYSNCFPMGFLLIFKIYSKFDQKERGEQEKNKQFADLSTWEKIGLSLSYFPERYLLSRA